MYTAAPVVSRAPRTSLIDAEWEDPAPASSNFEHEATWPAQQSVLAAREETGTLRSLPPSPSQGSWRQLLTVGAVALLSFGLGLGLHRALAPKEPSVAAMRVAPVSVAPPCKTVATPEREPAPLMAATEAAPSAVDETPLTSSAKKKRSRRGTHTVAYVAAVRGSDNPY